MPGKNNQPPWWQWGLLGGLGFLGLRALERRLIKTGSNRILSRLMHDSYDENLWEFISASYRTGLQTIIETNLRAERGEMILRPLGSPRHFPNFNKMVFNFAFLDRLPTPGDVPVDTSVVIGPQAPKPLRLEIPILVSGMAYGFGLSEKTKVALARGAARAGTATNTGEGPFLPSERRAAKYLIVQYNRGTWNKGFDVLRQADAIEIQLGQGAQSGTGHVIQSHEIDSRLRRQLGLARGDDAVIHAGHLGMDLPDNLPRLVQMLREQTNGIPIGAKLGAGKYLERDLAILVDAGVDFIAVDGAQAATKGSPPIIQDDFGLPTLYAVYRAAGFLDREGLKEKVSLIAAGGLYNPGDFLKAMALGADAVYIGTVALFAMAHTQTLQAMPWEPPTQVVFYNGQFAKDLNVKMGAHHLANYLQSATLEMAEGVRALGKTAVSQVTRDDLMALDRETAAILHLTPAYEPVPVERRSIPGRRQPLPKQK